MTAKEKYHRAAGYARASKRFCDAFVTSLSAPPLTLDLLRQHEASAWDRLPENVKQAVAR